MKERPILFSAPMVRALLAGSKTQTRRVWKLPKWAEWDLIEGGEEKGNLIPKDQKLRGWYSVDEVACPYGQVGDRLWVRETHLPKASGTIYRADFSEFEAAGLGGMYGGWKPSIFCKREYSRITLEIVSVRVERLQDISYEDALAEGVSDLTAMLRDECKPPDGESGNDCARRLHWPQRLYEQLWESINGAGSWDVNPWVWCIEFKVMKP